MNAGLLGHLYGVGANVSRRPMDKYGLAGSYLTILEEHLPSRDSHNWSRGRLDEVQCLRFLRHPLGRRQSIFCICATELLVCCPVYLIAELETRNIRSDSFDNSG